MKHILYICTLICLSLVLPANCSAEVIFSLKYKDVKYVSVSPEMFGEYQVVIELMGPRQLELARVTGSNVGDQIDIYISDTLIGKYPITVKVDSGFIVVGKYGSIDDAVSRIANILTGLNKSK